MRRLIDTFERFNLNESRKNLKLDILKDREELIDIFKWISDDDYNGEYPNFQLQGEPNEIKLHFQRFFGENQFEIEEWLISGVNYVMEVYGYKYTPHCGEHRNSKPVSISYELDNPNYDELSDLLHDEEGVIAGGKSPKNSNKKIMKSETFDKIEDVLGLKVNTLSIRISKVSGLNEAFKREVTFYKIVDSTILASIKKLGLLPGPDGGTYTIAEENFDDWLKPNKLFGSLLQALLFFPARRLQKSALLKIKMNPDQVKVRDVSLMLKDMKGWEDSMVDITDLNDTNFEISEYIIMGIVPPSKIEVVNEFIAVEDIANFKIDPKSLKDYVFGFSTDLKKIGKLSKPMLYMKYIWLILKLKLF